MANVEPPRSASKDANNNQSNNNNNTNDDNQSNCNPWTLTEYERSRLPQEITLEDMQVTISPRTVQRELMCPICLDVLKKPMTTRVCLHRFCSDCITTALRSGNKECPTCRLKLKSKRCLRSDPHFDQIISCIYPGRDQASEKDQATDTANFANSNARRYPLDLELTLHNLGNEKITRSLRTSQNATVAHLIKYLAMRPTINHPIVTDVTDDRTELTICACADKSKAHYDILTDKTLTLSQLREKYANGKNQFELYFCQVSQASA